LGAGRPLCGRAVIVRHTAMAAKVDKDSALVGRRARVSGLQARPDLNGKIVVVLPPKDNVEAEELRAKGRVKVTAFPKCLSIKVECLKVVAGPGDPQLDWTWTDGEVLPGTGSLLSTVTGLLRYNFPGFNPKGSRVTLKSGVTGGALDLGGIDRCDELSKELWHLITRDPAGNVIPMPPQRPLLKDESEMLGTLGGWEWARNAILNNTQVHALYYLALDAVSHHLVIETNAGLARVHQAFIRAEVEVGVMDQAEVEAPRRRVLEGYTAREWETPHESDDPHPLSPFDRAQRRWGGGIDISRAELEIFIDKLFLLQELSTALAVEMEAQLPPELVAQENESAATEAAWVAGGGEPRVHDSSPRQRWFDMLKKHPHWATMTVLGDKGAIIQSHPRNFPSDAGWGPFAFTVSNPVFADFCRVHVEVTGCSPCSGTLISILGFGSQWAKIGLIHEGTGLIQACGWAFVAGTIPH
jgi:hypothetical protein